MIESVSYSAGMVSDFKPTVTLTFEGLTPKSIGILDLAVEHI